MHRYLLHNGRVSDTTEKLLAAGQVGLHTGWGVFSTIRVIRGVLFAFKRHWARMSRDAALMHVPMPANRDAVERDLHRLIEKNGAQDSTLRLIVVRNNGGIWSVPSDQPSDLIAFTADLKDWGRSVKLDYVCNARHAANPFSGTKVLAWAHNLTWLEAGQQRGFDEVILLNERGEVAECTSANIFAAKGNDVWTPPLSSGCLPGITRELLLGEVRAPGIRLTEKVLLPAGLEDADEVFITSTTRELLAVSMIGERPLKNAGHTREALQEAYSQYVDEYLRSHI